MKKYVCLFLAFLLLVGSLSGCALITTSRLPSTDQDTDRHTTETQKPKPETTQEPEIQPTDAPAMDMNDPITELYALELSDSYGYTGSYHVPQINCDTPDALAINREIAEHYSPIVEEEQGHIASDVSIICYKIEWQLIANGDRFALIVSCLHPGDSWSYKVYNFDSLTGARLSNAELLNQFNMEMYEFLDLAQAAAEAFFVAQASSMGVEQDDYYWELLEATISDDVICPDMPLFVNENGGLSIITPIGSFAGAEFYWKIIPIT